MTKMERVKNISLSEVKHGQFIKLEDGNCYCVVKRGQDYKLIPIVLSKVKTVNQYSINQPKILCIFKENGDCIKVLDKEIEDD